jgi:hypothetical protein
MTGNSIAVLSILCFLCSQQLVDILLRESLHARTDLRVLLSTLVSFGGLGNNRLLR